MDYGYGVVVPREVIRVHGRSASEKHPVLSVSATGSAVNGRSVPAPRQTIYRLAKVVSFCMARVEHTVFVKIEISRLVIPY